MNKARIFKKAMFSAYLFGLESETRKSYSDFARGNKNLRIRRFLEWYNLKMK